MWPEFWGGLALIHRNLWEVATLCSDAEVGVWYFATEDLKMKVFYFLNIVQFIFLLSAEVTRSAHLEASLVSVLAG